MAERENTVWGEIRVQLSDVQNFLLNGQYKEAVILDKEILTLLVRMQIDQGCQRLFLHASRCSFLLCR